MREPSGYDSLAYHVVGYRCEPLTASGQRKFDAILDRLASEPPSRSRGGNPARDVTILRHHYGIDGAATGWQTLRATAETFGLSQARVGAIINRLQRYLRTEPFRSQLIALLSRLDGRPLT